MTPFSGELIPPIRDKSVVFHTPDGPDTRYNPPKKTSNDISRNKTIDPYE